MESHRAAACIRVGVRVKGESACQAQIGAGRSEQREGREEKELSTFHTFSCKVLELQKPEEEVSSVSAQSWCHTQTNNSLISVF